ncbi:hypothetical protein [Micromonospora sp. LOL_023]|uniref:hypothetical protein n=1 Tax=Micromonospora sp. LOL_023 TaxID=3345418 RepID=UPI003A88C819
MSEPKTKRIPAPLYAVAGVGDLAYQQLRKLPETVTELTGKATGTTAELRTKAVQTTAELRERANSGTELERLRAVALRNRDAVVAGAHSAGQRAVAIYGSLVAHGERVVGTGVVRAADTVNADMEATEAPAQVAAVPQPTPAAAAPAATDEAESPAATGTPATVDGAKPAKRNRPAK